LALHTNHSCPAFLHVVQDGGAHADQRMVAHRAAMQNGVVADGAVGGAAVAPRL